MDRYLGIDPTHVIGSGSYGVVYKVQDRFTNETLALKKLVDETRSTSKGLGVPYYVVREISLLRELRHENIVHLRDCVFDDLTGSLSLVFEYVETDLHQYIQDHEEVLNPHTVQSLLYQCLNGIACCHESGIIHRGKHRGSIALSIAIDCIADTVVRLEAGKPSSVQVGSAQGGRLRPCPHLRTNAAPAHP